MIAVSTVFVANDIIDSKCWKAIPKEKTMLVIYQVLIVNDIKLTGIKKSEMLIESNMFSFSEMAPKTNLSQ